MKAYTDLEQSKKLAEILPVESADMTWVQVDDHTWKPTIGLDAAIKGNLFSYRNGYILPCWSLSTLFSFVRFWFGIHPTNHGLAIKCGFGNEAVTISNNPVDTCYEMILKLHELKKI